MLKQHFSAFFIAFLLLLSTLVHYGRLGASFDGSMLRSDTAHYSSVVAATKYPEAFVKDPVFFESSRYEQSMTPMLSLVSFLDDDGNVGRTYLELTGVQFFLHCLVFYGLGLFLLQKPWQAALFSLLLTQAFWMPFGTYWGNGYPDYLPRSTFEIFYGIFLICAFRLTHKPYFWPFFMFASGLLVYIHSLSTPPAAFCFWLGFAFYRPQGWSWLKHMAWSVFCGLLFMATFLPYLWEFAKTSTALSSTDNALMNEVVAMRYNEEFTNYTKGMMKFLKAYWPAFVLGIAGYMALQKWGDNQEKERARLFAIWSLAILLCVFMYLIDQYFAVKYNRSPYGFEFIRVMRFWIFFSICLAFMGLNTLWKIIPNTAKARNVLTVCVCALALGLAIGSVPQKLQLSLGWYWNSVNEERFNAAYGQDVARLEMLNALMEHTSKGSLIFDPLGDRAIRYKALRGLAYNLKDSTFYYYTKNMDGLRKWRRIHDALQQSPTAYIDMAMQSGSDYVVSHRLEDLQQLKLVGQPVWQNASFILVKLHKN